MQGTGPVNILNVGCGFMPITATDIRRGMPGHNNASVGNVINYDPMTIVRTEPNHDIGIPTYLYTRLLTETAESFPARINGNDVDTAYYMRENDLPNLNYGVVMSISPFGYSVVSQYVHSHQTLDDYVVAFGANANPWIRPRNVAGAYYDNYVEVTERDVASDSDNCLVLNRVLEMGSELKNSNQARTMLSDGMRETTIQKVTVMRRCCIDVTA